MYTKIIDNLETAKDYVNKLKKNFEEDKDKFLEEDRVYLSISMIIFTIINSFIEIGEEIVDLEDYKIPTSYREVFEILGKENIISKELCENLKRYIKYRNMIAHQYSNVNLLEIYRISKNHEIFEEFISCIENYLKGKT
jgi:uncharacterized protein YutE (UPF0331/DUF86 family)